MISQKNITHLVVGKDVALLTSSQTREDLTAGKVGVFKNGSINATTSALSAGDRFKIVYKDVDGNIVESPFLDYSNIVIKNAAAYAADAEQKTYVGYNGTTGSITVANSSDYYIHLDRKDSSKTYGEYTLYKMVAAYKSDSSATETEIADALVANAAKNLGIEKTKSGIDVTKVGRINSATVTASNDFVNNIIVAQGVSSIVGAAKITLTGTSGTASITGVGGLTKTATFNSSLTQTATDFVTTNAAAYAAVGITLTSDTASLIFTPANATVGTSDPAIANATGDLAGTVFTAFEYATNTDTVVGDYIRLGATTTTATALTSNVYKVTAISGNVITLDIPIVEASGTYAAGSGYVEVIPASTAAAADWGIMFESQPVKFVPGLFKNQQVTFEVALSEAFGSTITTENTSPAKGSGTYQEVAEIEWELKGNRGEPFRVATYPVTKNLNADSTKTYDTIYVQVTNNNSTDIDHEVKSWISILIFTEDESSATAHTDLKTVLGIS